jgi:hypothetical protein
MFRLTESLLDYKVTEAFAFYQFTEIDLTSENNTLKVLQYNFHNILRMAIPMENNIKLLDSTIESSNS